MPEDILLLQAFKSNNLQEAKQLLENGSSLPGNLPDFDKGQIFDKIIREKAFDLVNLLTDRGFINTDIYEYDTFEKTIFESIVRYIKNEEVDVAFLDDFLKKLDNINDETGDVTLLGFALEKGADTAVIRCLVNAGADINYVNNAEETFLHQVIKNNRIKPELSFDYAELLIGEGLDVNAANIVQKTPLILAVEENKVALTDLLLQHGADCNQQDKAGESAFFHAIVHQQNFNLYSKLSEFCEPRFDQANNNRETILFELIRRQDRVSENTLNFVMKLIDDGADLLQPSIYYSSEKTPLDVIAEKPFDLFNAVMGLDKVDINTVYDNGNTLLHKVCAFDINFDKDKARDTYRKVKFLIDKGADVAVTNNNDETALMLASKDNLKTKTVELLLSNKS